MENIMITEFQGANRFLSNFYPAEVEYGGLTYPTVEHAYQAAKTNDTATRIRIRGCSTPSAAKRLAKTIPLRDNWNEIKLVIMAWLVGQKFLRHKDLQQKLLATGDAELIEGNRWGDKFWGVCGGQGENHLGKILMHTRKHIREHLSATEKHDSA